MKRAIIVLAVLSLACGLVFAGGQGEGGSKAKKYTIASIMFQEDSYFRALGIGMKDAADKAGVSIVTGDNKVVPRGKADRIFIVS